MLTWLGGLGDARARSSRFTSPRSWRTSRGLPLFEEKDPGCLYCPEVWGGDVEHTLCVCLRGARTESAERALRRQVAPEDLGRLLCGNPTADRLANDQPSRARVLRSTLTIVIDTILTEKEEDEWSREA